MKLWNTAVSERLSYGSGFSGFILSFLVFLDFFLRRRVVEVELLLEESELPSSLDGLQSQAKVQNLF